jgi:hypothetical protein
MQHAEMNAATLSESSFGEVGIAPVRLPLSGL